VQKTLKITLALSAVGFVVAMVALWDAYARHLGDPSGVAVRTTGISIATAVFLAMLGLLVKESGNLLRWAATYSGQTGFRWLRRVLVGAVGLLVVGAPAVYGLAVRLIVCYEVGDSGSAPEIDHHADAATLRVALAPDVGQRPDAQGGDYPRVDGEDVRQRDAIQNDLEEQGGGGATETETTDTSSSADSLEVLAGQRTKGRHLPIADGEVDVIQLMGPLRREFHDPVSGLWWQHPPAAAHVSWREARAYCMQLSGGGGQPGQWRLPNTRELCSLTRYCNGGPDCERTCDEHGSPTLDGCWWPDELSSRGGRCGWFWSSENQPRTHGTEARVLFFDTAGVGSRDKRLGENYTDTTVGATGGRTRCVRGIMLPQPEP
jgi:hypothetical protein